MPKVSNGPKHHCPSCNRDRSVKLFGKHPDICNPCFYFDQAANITFSKAFSKLSPSNSIQSLVGVSEQ